VALGIILAARETPALAAAWDKVAGFVMPMLIGWIALAILRTFVEAMYLRYDISVEDNRNARRRRTRLGIISRIISFGIIFLTVSLMLLSIPGVAKIGVTLMASAGLAALAVGAAAQPALKALIAGFQMALTEPISIDDVVILDGEWGRIEDIRTTYVVVRLWDDRRLVVPTTRFLEETFQNWTKRTSQLLGYVMIYLDPSADIAPIREEYTRQITNHRLWDKRAQILQVTDHSHESMEVRLLLSAKDGPTLFDLRCEIREGMLDWIRRNQPEALPRRRNLAVETKVGPAMNV
jgi:small-conductance mechanosensitive channel